MKTGRPVRILEKKHNNGKSSFTLDEQALKNILFQSQVFQNKVAVISIVGPPHTGKSFLLSFFQRYLDYGGQANWMQGNKGTDLLSLNGFAWDRDTLTSAPAIWLWSEPFVVDVNGENIAVLLMDTQGTFDGESSIVFAFSTLMSSVQIFNLDKKLQMVDLDQLHYCTSYAKLAVWESECKPFQQLQFLIRNWNIADKYELGENGGRRYLERVLQAVDQPDGRLNDICHHIDECFEDIGCFLLPSPGERANSDPHFKGALEHIKEDFKQLVGDLAVQLLSPQHLKRKFVNGNGVTCRSLFHSAEMWMKKLNSRDMPVPNTKHDVASTSTEICLKAYRAALRDYKSSMLRQCRDAVYSEEELQSYSDIYTASALLIYDNVRKFGSHGCQINRKFREKLELEIQDLYVVFLLTNEERRRTQQWKRIAVIGGGLVVAAGAAAVVAPAALSDVPSPSLCPSINAGRVILAALRRFGV